MIGETFGGIVMGLNPKGNPQRSIAATEHKFTVDVGFLMRNKIRRGIREVAFKSGVDCDISEERGWLESTLCVKFTGSDNALRHSTQWLQRWFDYIDGDE